MTHHTLCTSSTSLDMIPFTLNSLFANTEITKMSNTLKLLNTYYKNVVPDTLILTPETVQSLYNQLMDINPNTATLGICNEIDRRYLKDTRLLKTLFKIWPDYSLDSYFPIKAPAPLKLDSREAYFLYKNSSLMWHPKSIYGAARRRLWAFCIAVLEEMLEDQSWAKNSN